MLKSKMPSMTSAERPVRLPKFVVTGGPGFGKSTLMAQVAQRTPFQVFKEAAREIIDDTLQRGSNVSIVWSDRHRFYCEIADIMDRQYSDADSYAVALFDRGTPDLLAWRRYYDLRIPDRELELARDVSYNRIVFLVPPWPEIFETNATRPFTFFESAGIHDHIVAEYEKCGYSTVEIPKVDPTERATFLIDHINTILGSART